MAWWAVTNCFLRTCLTSFQTWVKCRWRWLTMAQGFLQAAPPLPTYLRVHFNFWRDVFLLLLSVTFNIEPLMESEWGDCFLTGKWSALLCFWNGPWRFSRPVHTPSRWGNWGTESWSNLSKVKYWGSGRVSTGHQIPWVQVHELFSWYHCTSVMWLLQVDPGNTPLIPSEVVQAWKPAQSQAWQDFVNRNKAKLRTKSWETSHGFCVVGNPSLIIWDQPRNSNLFPLHKYHLGFSVDKFHLQMKSRRSPLHEVRNL